MERLGFGDSDSEQHSREIDQVLILRETSGLLVRNCSELKMELLGSECSCGIG